mgnify:CR=1 FL=1
MERLPIWLSAVGERTAGPGTADMNRFPLHGMRQLRLPMALIERPVQGHSNEEGTGAPQQGSTAVRTVCFCFHYDGSRKNVNKIFKNSSAERVEKIRQKTRRQLHWTKQIAGILRHIPYRNEMYRRE